MAAIIALTPPLIPLICFMDLANFMFLSRSCTHKEEEGQPHSSNTSRKSFARLFSLPVLSQTISHIKILCRQRIFFNVNNVYAMSQCLKIGHSFNTIWDFLKYSKPLKSLFTKQKSMGNMLKLKVCAVCFFVA